MNREYLLFVIAVLGLVLACQVTPGLAQIPGNDGRPPRATDQELPEQPEFEEPEEEAEEIETDRDSFTPATTIVRPGRLLMEAAYSFIDNRNVKETHSYPELLFRYGLNEVVELRLGWNSEIGGAGSPVSGNTPSGLDVASGELEEEARLLYGTKLYLTGQTGWTPTSSFILQGFTPTYGESNHTDVSATYVFGWTLPSEAQLDFAARYGTGRLEEDEFNTWEPSAVYKFPLSERAKAHVEYFGVFTEGREEETTLHFFSPGAHYLITPDLEIGLRVGWGLNEQSPNFFANAGFGWLF